MFKLHPKFFQIIKSFKEILFVSLQHEKSQN